MSELYEISRIDRAQKIFGSVETGTSVSLTNVKGGLQGFLALSIFADAAEENRSTLFLTPTDKEARRRYNVLRRHQQAVCYFAPQDVHDFFSDAYTLDATKERQQTLRRALTDGPVLAVCSVEALLGKLPDPRAFLARERVLRAGDTAEIEDISALLTDYGYERVDQTEAPGQFSVRGGIIDIFVITDSAPVRVDFFDNEIDTLRRFDPATQRSADSIERLKIVPLKENWMPEAERAAALKKILKRYADNARYAERIEKITAGGPLAADILSVFSALPASFLAYLTRESEGEKRLPAVVWSEPAACREHAQQFLDRVASDYDILSQTGEAFEEEKKHFFSYSQIESRLRACPLYKLYTFGTRAPKRQTIDMDSRAIESFAGQPKIFADFLNNRMDRGYYIHFFARDAAGVEKIKRFLNEIGIAHVAPEGSEEPGIRFSVGEISEGFELAHDKIVFLNESDFFKKQPVRRRKTAEGTTRKIDRFTDLKSGDYVVHDVHGIGKYLGIVQMEIDGATKDLMHIEYAGGDALYIPVEQMNSVQVYIGTGGDAAPKISKMGSPEWANAKKKAKRAVADMADELIALYAKRRKAKGHAFEADTAWQRDFEDAFLYEETDDQLRSIEEIKQDMQKPVPMDRLLCGDVGYGKTEVAFRAAFKAAMEGKQTAILVPTTVLSQQHYNSALERFQKYPIHVDVLSRFRTPTEQKQVLKDLKSGKTDIIIGTHRLLSKDVKFKDLGLLIVDEEQRFGVRSKEKIKQMRENIDVLTLSATPIPRTLHMSLSGVRDMSVLEEPPKGRLPVQTYVMRYSEPIVKDAVERELQRGGQLYYIHNRVHDIDGVARRLQELVPQARIVTAHGKMTAQQLENVMQRFLDKEYDILVATTIVESGLDVKNANTIIVEDGDHYGLSQLYQLRGRVGRSDNQAYAYITHGKDILSETAAKRLKAIRDFTAFGSGFKIALRDLEIRGAGNLLGSEQSGHLAKIGYELYTRILEETITEKMTGKKAVREEPVTIQLQADAYIPAGYIVGEEIKYDIYKKLAYLSDMDDYDAMEDELIDRFGDVPQPVYNLMMTAMIKNAAQRLALTDIIQRGQEYRLVFRDAEAAAAAAPGALAVFEKPAKLYLNAGSAEKPAWTFRTDATGYNGLKRVYTYLSALIKEESKQTKGEKH